MTASLNDQLVDVGPGETVLEALERMGADVASGCRAGTCCKCMLQADDPPPESQRGLRATLREQGWFLACQARPERPELARPARRRDDVLVSGSRAPR